MTLIGAGKYDDEATMLRYLSGAQGVVVIVFGGQHGHGFSVQGPASLTAALPDMLREMANQIENDAKGIKE